MSSLETESKAQPNVLADEPPQSRMQPLWHVAVLTVLTMFTYFIVWFYKSWKELAVHAETLDQSALSENSGIKPFKKISPLLRTIGTLVPGLQLYLTTLLFVRAAQLYPNKNSPVHKCSLVIGVFMTAAMVAILYCSQLPDAFRLLYLFAAAPLVVAQSWINSYWKTQEPADAIVRHAFSTGELAALILGAVLLGLNVTGAVIH